MRWILISMLIVNVAFASGSFNSYDKDNHEQHDLSFNDLEPQLKKVQCESSYEAEEEEEEFSKVTVNPNEQVDQTKYIFFKTINPLRDYYSQILIPPIA